MKTKDEIKAELARVLSEYFASNDSLVRSTAIDLKVTLEWVLGDEFTGIQPTAFLDALKNRKLRTGRVS